MHETQRPITDVIEEAELRGAIAGIRLARQAVRAKYPNLVAVSSLLDDLGRNLRACGEDES